MFRLGQAGYLALVLFLVSTTAKAETGINPDRLSPKHRKVWEAIRQIIIAEDADGTSLHPTLRNLFDRLQTSNHTIYLEFDETDAGCHCLAGVFTIEQLDPAGLRNIGVIRLYLRNIRHVAPDSSTASKDEFVPLLGLKKLERYAEVLGHEMAHAVDILFNQERATLIDDILKQTDEVLEQRVHSKTINPEWEQVLRQRDAFLGELEKPAVMLEEQIWRELRK